jgi:hypothetical protein
VNAFTITLLLALALPGLAQKPASPIPASTLHIEEARLPDCLLGDDYDARLRASAGSEPLKWEVVKGQLPAGLKLAPRTGRIMGKCEVAGEAHFTVRVTGSSKPSRMAEHDFTLRVPPPIEVEWKSMPVLQDGGIHGSVTLTNGLKDEYEVTLIIVAVNEVGKAFVLGYQHHALRRKAGSEEVAFGGDMLLPRGRYIVHVDAVGEDLVKKNIYRARLQTHEPLIVP